MDENRERAPLRVLLAVGNAERERRLQDALSAAGLAVTGRCLEGASLADRASSFDFDVALVSSDLHRLSTATLFAIREARLPVVLLASASDLDRYTGLAHLMPVDAGAAEVATAVQEAWGRGASYAPRRKAESDDLAPASDVDSVASGRVIAVVSGKGAPGATTVAIGLAAALRARGRNAALVDADLRGGNVAAYLDLDPRRGLLAVGYGDSSALGARVDEELQDAGGFSVLAGIERSESRSRVSSELLVGAITMLAGRYDEVVVDVGETLAGTTPAAVEAVMRAANTVLLVVRSDLVSLWNTRACLQHLREGIGVEHGALQIVINRQGGHSGYDAAAVQSALAAPVLAALPEDRRAIAAAVERQSPVTANGGRLARELRSLAKRLSAEATDAAPAHQSAFGRWRRAPVENV